MRLIKKKLYGPTIPVINIHGIINPQRAQKVMNALYKMDTSTAVALAVSINSRGGFPAQSQIIASHIRSFATKNNLKLYTFAGDHAASGGYAVLCVGDQVYADRVSLVGSIGVVWKRYSLNALLDSVDLTQYTIESQKTLKSALNPFLPFQEADHEVLKGICKNSHEKFIEYVKQKRKGKLDLTKADQLFGGDAISGEDALKLGLIDGIGTMTEVLYKKHPDAQIKIPTPLNLRQRLFS